MQRTHASYSDGLTGLPVFDQRTFSGQCRELDASRHPAASNVGARQPSNVWFVMVSMLPGDWFPLLRHSQDAVVISLSSYAVFVGLPVGRRSGRRLV